MNKRRMKIRHILNQSAIYILPILLIFLVATVEYNALTAIDLILKLIAFGLSMILPISSSARLSTFSFSGSSGKIEKFLRLDIAAFIFASVQFMLWLAGLHQIQMYIAGTAVTLFIVTLLIFLIIRSLGNHSAQ